MRILVANLGSTSFKYKLLDMSNDGLSSRARRIQRIGQAGLQYPDHAVVIHAILHALPQPPDAIGFKAVHGGPISGAVRVDERVLATMEQFADVGRAQSLLHRRDASICS